MIEKKYYINIEKNELLCDQFRISISLFLSEFMHITNFMEISKRKQFHDIATDMVELLLELESGSKETNQHIELIKKYHKLDGDDTTNIDLLMEKLYHKLVDVMPVARMCLMEAVKRTEACREDASLQIKEEESRLLYAEKLTPLSVEQSALISRIIGKQKAKVNCKEYIQHNMNRENHVAKFLCTIYLESAFSEFISVGLLKSAVELDIVTESDISNILKKNGDKRDYEWYMEEQCSCFLHDETIIKISEILQVSTDSIENELGFKCFSV